MTNRLAAPYSMPQAGASHLPAAPLGPYVPASQRRPRVKRAALTPPYEIPIGNGPMPWIDAFLAATPAAGVAVIPGPVNDSAPSPYSAPALLPVETPKQAAVSSTKELPAVELKVAPQVDQQATSQAVHQAALQVAPQVAPEPARESTAVPGLSTSSRDRSEAAAQALEMLALRVRAGELPLTGYDPALGDAAALVAALAALLGVRLAD